jgi:hypothetical protein
MRYLISVFLILVISSPKSYSQNTKLNLSTILNSILLSQNCSLKNEDEKLYFFTYKDKTLQDVINFDSYCQDAEIVYKTDKKKVIRKLKKVEFGYDISIKIISQNENKLVLNVDLPKINYDLYTKSIKSKIQVLLADSWWHMQYTLKNDKWMLSEMTCNGF